MQSYWERKTFLYHRHLIICGAGFTGLSAAIHFKRLNPDRSVLVLEKDPINGGASTRNAGFACFGSPSEILADLRTSPESEVFDLVEKRWQGLQYLRTMLGDEAIRYRHHHGFELFRPDDPLYALCSDKLSYLNQHLRSVTGTEPYRHADAAIAGFGFGDVAHIIENTEEGQVDTGAMYHALLRMAREHGVDIFNGIHVHDFEEAAGISVYTSSGMVTCDKLLIATNGFSSQLWPQSETLPARGQVLITAPINNLPFKGIFHLDEGFYYFRNIDNRILLGGGRNMDVLTETTTERALNQQIQQRLEELLSTVILPGTPTIIDMRWSGIMGMGPVKQVIVKRLSDRTFCAVRLSGMGLSLSTLLGKQVAELMHE